jgi:hypothetical protein
MSWRNGMPYLLVGIFVGVPLHGKLSVPGEREGRVRGGGGVRREARPYGNYMQHSKYSRSLEFVIGRAPLNRENIIVVRHFPERCDPPNDKTTTTE